MRKLAAIMFTDIVGFSRQMGADEARMLRLLEVHHRVVQQAVSEYRGHVIKTMGDAFLVDFPSVVHAVQCAQQIQARLRTYNTHKEQAEQIHVRIGIHLGDIVQKDDDVFGDGVNIASRLQELAEPDSICISHIVYQEVAKKLSLGTVISLGRPKLKNIAERFAIYALLPAPPQGLRQTLQVQRLKLSRRVGTAHRVLAGGLLTAGVILMVWYLALPALEAIANELASTGVTVTALCPGPTQSEFQQRAHIENTRLFKGKFMGLMTAAAVAQIGYRGFMQGKRLVIPGLLNRIGVQSVRLAPRRLTTQVARIRQES
jgi:class 3 adenylate cyclase